MSKSPPLLMVWMLSLSIAARAAAEEPQPAPKAAAPSGLELARQIGEYAGPLDAAVSSPEPSWSLAKKSCFSRIQKEPTSRSGRGR